MRTAHAAAGYAPGTLKAKILGFTSLGVVGFQLRVLT
jgi:hypothetical protein